MARRDEYTSPLGRIIVARAEVLGGRRGDDAPDKPLSLAEMSALTNGQLTRAAINEWILGRVKNPMPDKLEVLARALAGPDYRFHDLLNDMRAAVGMPHRAAKRTVDVEELADADVEAVQFFANRLRDKGREAAHEALAATERALGFIEPRPRTRRDPQAAAASLADNHHSHGVAAVGG